MSTNDQTFALLISFPDEVLQLALTFRQGRPGGGDRQGQERETVSLHTLHPFPSSGPDMDLWACPLEPEEGGVEHSEEPQLDLHPF